MVKEILNAFIINNLRILKARNPGDTYYEEYLKHYNRDPETFFDQYHRGVLAAVARQPKRILEIGVRTGLSICNILSAYIDHSKVERVVLCDIWNDGFASPEIVKMNLKALNIKVTPEFIVGDSRVEIPKLEGEFDYILVDGDHSKQAALIDLNNVIRLCAPGGMIVFDDISVYGCDLLDVWEAFKLEHMDKFDFYQDMGGKGTGWCVCR